MAGLASSPAIPPSQTRCKASGAWSSPGITGQRGSWELFAQKGIAYLKRLQALGEGGESENGRGPLLKAKGFGLGSCPS